MQKQIAQVVSLLLCFFFCFQNGDSYSQTKDIHSEEINNETSLKTNSFKDEIDFYAEKQDYKNAIRVQLELVKFQDSVAQTERIKAIDKLRTEFDTKQKENELAIANALQQSQLNQMESQNLQKYIYASVGFIMILVVLGLLSRLNFMRRTQNELKEKGMNIALEKVKAEESEKVREQFLAKMSHEIRTPMNAIVGMTSILKRNKHYPHQDKYLEAIRQSSENLMVILNDILDLSRLESGKVVIDNFPFKPVNELMKLRDILKYKAEEKGLSLQCELDPQLPEVLHGDPIRLSQILINLTGNAIKFTEEGNIFVRIGLKEISDSTAVVEGKITDTGIGIQEDRLDKIFESFTQAESNTTRKYGGTGLGLTISKELVHLQNGHIKVESKKGEGSTFTFTIPYKIGDASELKTVTQNNEPISLKALKILLVENNAFNIIVARDELNQIIENPLIDLADNGFEALEKVEHNNYDLILMDIEMAEMNGYDCARAIRQLDPPKNNIPIIAITANAMPQEILKCYDAGMDDHLPKPFKQYDLQVKIQHLVAKKTT
jgi:signal transduction histidine kinase/ActR/RegA family two-component response regulator